MVSGHSSSVLSIHPLLSYINYMYQQFVQQAIFQSSARLSKSSETEPMNMFHLSSIVVLAVLIADK